MSIMLLNVPIKYTFLQIISVNNGEDDIRSLLFYKPTERWRNSSALLTFSILCTLSFPRARKKKALKFVTST